MSSPARLVLLLSVFTALSCSGDTPGTTDSGSADDGATDSGTTDDGGTDSGADADPYDVTVGPYEVDIRWTEYGVPHVLADDIGSASYGLGYAYAQLHACTLLDEIVYTRSERARWFGAGDDDEHIDTDFGWKALKVREYAEAGFLDMDPEIQASLIGYAAGVNQYVQEAEAGETEVPLAEHCRGAEWIPTVDHIDLLAYYLALGEFGSGAVFLEQLGQAQPPSASRSTERPEPPGMEIFDALNAPRMGSNGWALGKDRTESGRGMVLSNTHFPYLGERQWYEFHITVPGTVNVYGAALQGIPLVNLGFNEDVAWTHTVSNTPRFTVHILDLVSGNDTAYDYDGEERQMEGTEHTIQVLQADGSLEDLSRTLWRTHHGPMLNAPTLGWGSTIGVAIRNANENNLAMIPTWWGLDKADGLDSFTQALETHQGIPWVHTLAADKDGRAWYGDVAATPNWSEETEAAWLEYLDGNYLAEVFYASGAYVCDGGDPIFEWSQADGARAPGLMAYEDQPKVERSDYVFNANDNYWLPHPDGTLSGYPLLYGPAETARSARTRMNATYLMETGAGSASGEDGLFSLDELAEAALSARGKHAELLVDGVVARCQSAVDDAGEAWVSVDGTDVDIAPACDALAGWDKTATVEATGAALWREFLGGGVWDWDELEEGGGIYADTFDPADPIGTPSTLADAPAEGDDPVLQALAIAVQNLSQADLAPDVALGDAQFVRKGDQDISVGGGQFYEGVIRTAVYSTGGKTTLDPFPDRADTVNSSSDLTTEGYQINTGNSYVLAVEFTDDGPVAKSVLVYSQSDNADSPHFADQTELYSQRGFKDVRFTEADIAADPALVQVHLSHE